MPVPMDRSIPPAMMTNVVPRARIPVTVAAMRMPMRLLGVRKYGLAMKKKTMMTIRLAKARSGGPAPPPGAGTARGGGMVSTGDAEAGVELTFKATSQQFLRPETAG